MAAPAVAEASSNSGVPAMPVTPGSTPVGRRRRRKTAERWFPLNALVARPVNKRERLATPDAHAAMKKEWNRLREQTVWDEVNVREWDEVVREATPRPCYGFRWSIAPAGQDLLSSSARFLTPVMHLSLMHVCHSNVYCASCYGVWLATSARRGDLLCERPGFPVQCG